MPIAFAALALAVVAFVLWLSGLSKAKASSARVASLLVENASLQDQLKSGATDQKKMAKLLEQRSDELTEIKKEIGALKKKNFALQEEAKKTKTSFEAKLEEREKQLVAKPAFADDDEKPKAMKSEGSKAKADGRAAGRGPSTEGRAPHADAQAPMVDGGAASEARPADVSASVDGELTRKLENVTRENSDLVTRLGKLEADLRQALAEQRRMKKKVDDYRRADLVAKSRVELLNDKLGSIGRQYYDAVSELAALKGQNAPPPPRPPAEKVPDAQSAAEAAAPASESAEDDDVHALSNELVGVLQQRDNVNN